MDQIYWYFLDHLSCHPKTIAFDLQKQTRKILEPFVLNGTVEIFCTCQRIEIFSTKTLELKELNDLPFRKIVGYEAIRKRMLKISTGAISQILAESNIFDQVEGFSKYHCQNSMLRTLLREVLLEARFIRKQFQFTSSKGYEDISISLIERNTLGKNLLIIGSGMLARGIYPRLKYTAFKDVFYLTRRNPNSLKKKLGEDGENVTVWKVNSIDTNAFNSKPFSVIIATCNIDIEYENQISSILDFPKCKGIFDLSSKPLFQSKILEKKYYSDMYSGDYLEEVRAINTRLLHKQVEINKHIDEISHEFIL
ncbi:MAG: hypothetical protein RIM99_09740 [Cyclobacteriaceae bacterium]